jgi:putative SOS response-associated peptidase YedK
VVWFAIAGEERRPLFAFAGIWKRHFGPIRKGGEPFDIHVFLFMTTTPNELVATVNHERMPVLLSTPEMQDQWIDGS